MKATLSVPAEPLVGTVTISATFLPANKVTQVQFFIDGVLKSTDTASPFSFSWNSATVPDGNHVISIKGFYPRNQVTEAQVTRLVRNTVGPPPPPPVSDVPVNTTLPAITGTATQGQTLTVSDGLWTNTPTSYTRQWERCDSAGANCLPISSATGVTYTLTAADVGSKIRCVVTAFNSIGASAPAESAATAVVAGLAPAVPTIVTVPTITGAPVQNNTLSVSNGAWTNSPTSYTRQWQRSEAWAQIAVEDAPFTLAAQKEVRYGKGAAWTSQVLAAGSYVCDNAQFGDPAYTIVKVCEARPPSLTFTNISGATGATYVLAAADIGCSIRCRVTAINASGSSTPAASAATEAVSPVTAPPPPPPPPATGYIRYGITAGNASPTNTQDANASQRMGTKTVRVEFGIGNAASALDGAVDTYGARGIRVLPLAGFHARLPTSAECQNLRNWALRHGPLGTNKINAIEFGNETSYDYQFGGDGGTSSYFTRAQNYALKVKEAHNALSGTSVNLLIQAQEAGGGGWIDNMFTAVSDLTNYYEGVTIHPYGPYYATDFYSGPGQIDEMLSELSQHGDTTSTIHITEWGISSDNGRPLSDNYGWPVNMTYQQCADVLAPSISMWQTKMGARWVQTFFYQVRDQAWPGTESGRESYFGVQQVDGVTDKGAWSAAVRAKLVSA